MYFKIILTSFVLFCSKPTYASPLHTTTYQTIADSLNKLVKRSGLDFIGNSRHVGLSVGVIKNGVCYTYNFGTTNKNKHDIPTANTIYEIASVTKTFTGILLAHAVIENKIKLNDYVYRYLPGKYSNLAYKGNPLKIVDLVNHTSGLPKFLPGFKKGSSPAQLTALFNNLSEAQFLQSLQKVQIDAIPGTRFNYSNADAQLIGIILERVYHVKYGALIKKYITGPQHMYNTKLEISPADTNRFAQGYNGKGELMPKLTWWRAVPAAGYIKSTITDMLQYLQLNMNEKIAAIALAHKPTFTIPAEGGDHIAMFWFSKVADNGDKEVYHAGGSFGSTSYCELCPGRKNGVVLLANDAGDDTEHVLKTMAADIMKVIR